MHIFWIMFSPVFTSYAATGKILMEKPKNTLKFIRTRYNSDTKTWIWQ